VGVEKREDAVETDAVLTLVLGGARSGKSEVGERFAAARAGGAPVTYVATGWSGGGDDGHDGPGIGVTPDSAWADRIALHRARRPASWVTVEVGPTGDLAAVLGGTSGPVLLDSLGTWVAGRPGFVMAAGTLDAGAESLLRSLAARRELGRPTVVVSDEVGLGVVPSTAAGNSFRDGLGALNRQVAEAADQVVLVVAGRVLPLAVAP
jgi:adenosylcobinamide kinase/adenosylcobinamide-phosphate guanylyltransferase